MKYDVPLIPQTTRMSCWAASIAMILGWKKKMSIPDRIIAENPGGLNYMSSFEKGLNPNDKYILEANGFALDPPQCYIPELVNSLLSRHGPLWVASLAPKPHIRVVAGMTGQLLYINDPGPVGTGSQYTRAFSVFFGAMERLGEKELKQRSPVYVAYLAQ